MANVLVTGGAGFLGSHLCASLLKDGHNVLCVDNLSTGSKKNIKHLTLDPNFHFLIHDVRSAFYFDRRYKDIDQIYNLACPASPPAYQADSVGTLLTNFQGMYNVLTLAKEVGAKVFQASTSEIYGDPIMHPQHESYWGNVNTVGPRSCYDEGKRVAESLMTDYNRQYGVPIKIARIFNTYGPQMDKNDGRVVSNFVNQALSNKPITIYGSGLQTRSFCYVSDLIRGFRLLMDTNDGFILPVNLGNPTEFNMLELAELVIAKTNSKSFIEHKNLPVDDPQQRKPDISRAKEILGWEPTVALTDGLDSMIEYFRTTQDR